MRRSQFRGRSPEESAATAPGDVEAAPQIANTPGVETAEQRRRRHELDRQGIDHEDMAPEGDSPVRDSSEHSM